MISSSVMPISNELFGDEEKKRPSVSSRLSAAWRETGSGVSDGTGGAMGHDLRSMKTAIDRQRTRAAVALAGLRFESLIFPVLSSWWLENLVNEAARALGINIQVQTVLDCLAHLQMLAELG